MRKKYTAITMMVVLLSISTGLFFMQPQEASAHQRMPIGDNFIIIGHTNEPSFGAEDGKWVGKHDVQVLLRDADGNPLSGAELEVDKYYFENVKKYNKADKIKDAFAISRNNVLGEKHGSPGEYISHQTISSGIYGYDVQGTLADGQKFRVVAFCLEKGMKDPTKFERGAALSEFTCPQDIDDIAFPPKEN